MEEIELNILLSYKHSSFNLSTPPAALQGLVIHLILIRAFEDPIKVIWAISLVPPNQGLQSRELPHAVNLLVIMLVSSLAVTLQLDLLQVRRSVHLMSGTQLMVADNVIVGDLLPASSAEEMLRLDAWVTEELGVCDHGHEVLGGHGVPFSFANGGIIDEEFRGDDAFETFPVLRECVSQFR